MKRILALALSLSVLCLPMEARRRWIPKPSGGSLSYTATILAASPVGYWQLNETSGTSAIDQISANNGTYGGVFTLNQIPGPVTGGGGAPLFDGGSGTVIVPSASAYNSLSGTVEAWFKTSGDGDIIRRDDGSSDRCFLFRVSSSKLEGLLIFGGNPSVVSSSNVNDGAWHYAVLVWTQISGTTNIEIFLDGVSQGTNLASANYPTSSEPIYIASNHANNEFLNGLIGQFAYYNRALSSGEITAHYAAR